MNRDDALKLLREYITNENLIRHHLAVETVMIALAEKFGEDVDEWGVTGLLHDMDWELTKDNPYMHGVKSFEILSSRGVPGHICYAIKAHNHTLNLPFNTMLDKALFCAEELTGLITANALVQPDKKLASVTVESTLRKFKSKHFARGVNREVISRCKELLDMELEELTEICLTAMKNNSDQLGL